MKIIQDFLDKIEKNISVTQNRLEDIKAIRKQVNQSLKDVV